MIQNTTILEPTALLEVLRNGEREEFKALLRSQPEPIVDDAFHDASRAERLEFLRLMPINRAATTFIDLPLPEQADLLPELQPERLRLMGAYVGPDDIADILKQLGPDTEPRTFLLNAIQPLLAERALELERYPNDRVGGIMTLNFVTLRQGLHVEQAITHLRHQVEQVETITNLYLVDGEAHLIGVIPLERLLTGKPSQLVDDLAVRDVIAVRVNDRQENAARLMQDYDLLVLPVVDDLNVLRGAITVDDALDVVREEATDDIYKGAAIQGGEIDYRAASPLLLWRKRIGWLLILFVTESLTANVITAYDKLIAAAPLLAVYLPTLIGTGGNTGSQSATLVIRAIALGQVRGRDAWRVLFKEFGAGLLIGATIGVVAFFRIVIFRSTQGVGLAITAAVSMFLIAIFANITGALLPLLFKKLKIDPALTSSPFLATIMDATGLLIYFNIAKVVLRL